MAVVLEEKADSGWAPRIARLFVLDSEPPRS